MAFPTSPTDGQLYKEYKYNSDLGFWAKQEMPGELISEGTWTGSSSTDVVFDLPDTGYKTFDVWARVYGTDYTTDRGVLWTTIYDNSGNRLLCEKVTHSIDDDNRHAITDYGPEEWQLIDDYVDMSSGITTYWKIDAGNQYRPEVMIDAIFTKGGVGVTRASMAFHYTAQTTYGQFGFNVDPSDGTSGVYITEIQYRIIGYK